MAFGYLAPLSRYSHLLILMSASSTTSVSEIPINNGVSTIRCNPTSPTRPQQPETVILYKSRTYRKLIVTPFSYTCTCEYDNFAVSSRTVVHLTDRGTLKYGHLWSLAAEMVLYLNTMGVTHISFTRRRQRRQPYQQ